MIIDIVFYTIKNFNTVKKSITSLNYIYNSSEVRKIIASLTGERRMLFDPTAPLSGSLAVLQVERNKSGFDVFTDVLIFRLSFFF